MRQGIYLLNGKLTILGHLSHYLSYDPCIINTWSLAACLNAFIERTLGCRLPWLLNNGSSGTRICETEFWVFSFLLYTLEMKTEQELYHTAECVPDCVDTAFKAKTLVQTRMPDKKNQESIYDMSTMFGIRAIILPAADPGPAVSGRRIYQGAGVLCLQH